jgi:hypothetical protein
VEGAILNAQRISMRSAIRQIKTGKNPTVSRTCALFPGKTIQLDEDFNYRRQLPLTNGTNLVQCTINRTTFNGITS